MDQICYNSLTSALKVCSHLSGLVLFSENICKETGHFDFWSMRIVWLYRNLCVKWDYTETAPEIDKIYTCVLKKLTCQCI